jgi:hypothetical protein
MATFPFTHAGFRDILGKGAAAEMLWPPIAATDDLGNPR